jgi:hypothetical protein
MDSAEVSEIKRAFGVIAEGLHSEVSDVKRHVGVVAEGLRSEISDVKRHFGVLAEGLRSEIRQVAEGVSAVDARLSAFQTEVAREFEETRSMIRLS